MTANKADELVLGLSYLRCEMNVFRSWDRHGIGARTHLLSFVYEEDTEGRYGVTLGWMEKDGRRFRADREEGLRVIKTEHDWVAAWLDFVFIAQQAHTFLCFACTKLPVTVQAESLPCAAAVQPAQQRLVAVCVHNSALAPTHVYLC